MEERNELNHQRQLQLFHSKFNIVIAAVCICEEYAVISKLCFGIDQMLL